MKDLAYRLVPVVIALPAPSASLAGVIARLASDNRPYWCDGTHWVDLTAGGGDPRLTTVRLAEDVGNNTTALANVTGLAVALDANSTYAIDARVMFQTDATTTGIRLTQSVPSGATVVAQWRTPTTASAVTNSVQRSADAGAATASIDTANANTLALGDLLVVTGATAGNLQIRFASEVAGSLATIKAGSVLIAHKVT